MRTRYSGRMRALALLALLAAIPAEAAEPLELGKWLARPGVRLVAVELYATWCKPCIPACQALMA